MPDFTQWPSFPFEGEIRVKQLDDPVPVEPPRRGEADRECTACNAPDEAYIWVGERWRVRTMDRPTGLPMVLILESRSHLDLGDLPNLLAAELGVMTVRLERAIRSLDGVARVHVNRWGDGSAHLHMWFLARPYGRLQLRGTFLSLWDSILPPISEEQWRENLANVAAWLAEFGGRPLAEPPRIRWQAPSSLSSPSPASAAEEPDEEAASVIEAADEIPEAEPAEEDADGIEPSHVTVEPGRAAIVPATGNGGPADDGDAGRNDNERLNDGKRSNGAAAPDASAESTGGAESNGGSGHAGAGKTEAAGQADGSTERVTAEEGGTSKGGRTAAPGADAGG
ncbi:hypothetical protein [Micromonospora sp. NPDC049282]|uniref:hypothetical protein n=1 Tax=Micromonospora sp. NPDC049282 TaxID=3364269 RepID=UPI0037128C27